MDRKMIYYSIIFLVSGLFFGFVIGKSLSMTTIIGYNIVTHHSTISTSSRSIEIVFPLVAVTSQGEGVLQYATLRIVPGHGHAYIQINPFVEPDTQYAFQSAIEAACNLLNTNCSKYNFILSIHSNATLVGGPSAGLAFALATYYGLQGKKFPPYVAVTGTIDKKGDVGPVGGVFEKALAAAKSGKKLFIVPYGQNIVYRYERIEKKYQPYPGFVFIQVEYKPVPVNLTQLFMRKYGMEVVGVRNLKEAIEVISNFEK